MWRHDQLAPNPFSRSRRLKVLIDEGVIAFAGNKKLRIYGFLSCSSGKRMMSSHRVFFSSEEEAIKLGYRPCGNCHRQAYQFWKKQKNS